MERARVHVRSEMMKDKKTIQDTELAGKTVLVRVDYNVPFRPGTIEISDDSRIRASIPTVRYLVERGCKVVLCSHLGRPGGKVVDDLRMGPVGRRLSELLGIPVAQTSDCVGPDVLSEIEALPSGGVMVVENLRFHPGEEHNDPEFASALASLADVYVNDAFGTAHRAHASTEGITCYLPAVAGFLMARELEMLGRALDSPRRPFATIVGGAKISDKLAVLEHLARRVDVLLIGGGMAATFLKAKGLSIGDSLVEEDWIQSTTDLMRAVEGKGPDLILPVDVVVADSFSEGADHRVVPVEAIGSGWRIMDIGPQTISQFEAALERARTVVWNGTMGVHEWAPFAHGTASIAQSLVGLEDATIVVGGGSTAEAVDGLGLAGKMTHVSTGGGASLQFLEGKDLPGVAALLDKNATSSKQASVISTD